MTTVRSKPYAPERKPPSDAAVPGRACIRLIDEQTAKEGAT